MAIDCTSYSAGPGKAPAFIVLPGGGYTHHADHEGEAVARWLNAHGIHALVVRYAVGDGCYPRSLHDAREALAMLREGEALFDVLRGHVGVIGFSAGGHLAGLLATDSYELSGAQGWTYSGRPDVAILGYPVIELREAFSGRIPNRETRISDQLLGADASEELRAELSPCTRVTSPDEGGDATPPMFLWTTSDDEAVSVLHTTSMMLSLAVAGVAHEGHVFQSGEHGAGLAEGLPAGRWTELSLAWLRDLGWPVS